MTDISEECKPGSMCCTCYQERGKKLPHKLFWARIDWLVEMEKHSQMPNWSSRFRGNRPVGRKPWRGVDVCGCPAKCVQGGDEFFGVCSVDVGRQVENPRFCIMHTLYSLCPVRSLYRYDHLLISLSNLR